MNATKTPKKWRPSLTLIVIGMLAIVLSLPFASLLLFRFYDSQLVRETESELIAQGAAISATMQYFIEENKVPITALGAVINTGNLPDKGAFYTPILPTLELADEIILPPRPKGYADKAIVADAFEVIGKTLTPIIQKTKKITLAGFRVLDPKGRVIAGHKEIGMSLSHILEVNAALAGEYKSVIRQRISKQPVPALASISRGNNIRIFIAMPVVISGQVAGVVYISRTPSNVLKELYKQRWKVLLAIAFITLVTFLMGYVFIRTIKQPIEKLQLRSKAIGKGDRVALKPLKMHGSKELADLSSGMMDMAKKLFERADYIDTFATHVSHELKSPLTSIQGASELLRDQSDAMSSEQRKKFLTNIIDDTHRSVLLLDRLRALSKADNPILKGTVSIRKIIELLEDRFQNINFTFSGNQEQMIGVAQENALIIFSNLVENAENHAATEVTIEVTVADERVHINIHDNGEGISPENADKIFDLFFTTRREQSGTGMGLGIVQAMLNAHLGEICLKRSSASFGTTFQIELPVGYSL